MTTEEKKKKKQITQDWLNAFPELSAYTPNILCKIIGPIVVGIELITEPAGYFNGISYTPYFFCNALWFEDINACMRMRGHWIALHALKNKKNFQYNITYIKHDEYLADAVSYMKDQAIIKLEGNLNKEFMLKMIESQFEEPMVQVAFWPKSQVYNLKFYMALYLNNHELMEQTIQDLQRTEQEWKPGFIKDFYGSFDQWIENLRNDGNHRDEFLKRIENNRQEKRLKKLHYSELIP